MKIKLIAIAAIALSPAVVFGQTSKHIRVSKDGTHSSTTSSSNGDAYTAPAPTPAAAPAPAPEPTPAPAPAPAMAPADTTSAMKSTDSTTNQYGTGAPAATPTHSMQDSTASSTMSDSSSMKKDSTSAMSTPIDTTTKVDTVRVNRNGLSVSPIDSVRMGIPSTKATQMADSAKKAATPPQ